MTPPPAPLSSLDEVRLDDLGELIAGVPGLLGFPPVDSLVLVTFAAGSILGPTMRVDLPEPEHGPDLMEQLGLALHQNEVVAATAIVVGGRGAGPPVLPGRPLVELLSETLADLGVRLLHAVWVPSVAADVTWWCYEDAECSGQVRDPRGSSLAALRIVDGAVTFASRTDMQSLLAPDPEDRLAHRARLLAEFPGADPATLHRELLTTIESAAASNALPDLTDDRIVRLAAALAEPHVRDTCLLLAVADDAAATERLWTVLTRAVPAPERAEPAFLLALQAYLRGAAVYAGMALDVALAADPEHALAGLLRTALDSATPPHVVRWMIIESIRRATRAEPRPPRPSPTTTKPRSRKEADGDR